MAKTKVGMGLEFDQILNQILKGGKLLVWKCLISWEQRRIYGTIFKIPEDFVNLFHQTKLEVGHNNCAKAMDGWMFCWEKNRSLFRVQHLPWEEVNLTRLTGNSCQPDSPQTCLSLHLSLEVPASELEVTGNFQAICSTRYILGGCAGWWDDLYLLLCPPDALSAADLEIMARSTSPPLRSSASLLDKGQQRRTIHHFNSSSAQAHGPMMV